MPSNKGDYMKLYYQKNHDKILNNMLEKIVCPKCKENVMRGNINRHMKSKICSLKTEIFELKNNINYS
jgi:hypothetical protein